MSGALKVHSGQCCLCDVGLSAGAKDDAGRDLHTGDIVLIWHGEYLGTDLEQWTPSRDLSVVVATQYQSFHDGSVKLLEHRPPLVMPFFVMGIKDCGFDHPEWRIQIVKGFDEVVDGEHWKAYGFCFRTNAAADKAMEGGEA